MITLLAAMAMEFAEITKDYSMSKTEVTQSQYKEVMGNNPSHFKGEDLPVECVSWADCQLFCMTMERNDPKHVYRLPKNEEWSYACSKGVKTRFFFGDDPSQLGIVAWYRQNTTTPKEVKKGDWQSVGGSTHEVGKKMSNPFGLYDMCGNVWEWTKEGDIRGGCWWSQDLDCSTEYISKWPKDSRTEYVGFRVLRENK